MTDGWWSRGREWRPWAHVGAAFVIGAGLFYIAQSTIIGALVGLPVLLLVPVVIAAVLFGAAGRIFRGTNFAYWWALTALVWVAGAGAVFALVAISNPGGYDPSAWWAPLLAGVLPAVVTALGYAGPLRLAAILLLVATVATTIPFAAAANDARALANAQTRFGSPVRPYVTTISGFSAAPDPAAALGDNNGTVAVAYYRDRGPATKRALVAFELVTDSGTEPICGTYFAGADNSPELSCTRSGGMWQRRSKSAHEVAKIIDGHLIRVDAPTSTPESVLQTALDHARPMTDPEYHAVLFPAD